MTYLKDYQNNIIENGYMIGGLCGKITTDLQTKLQSKFGLETQKVNTKISDRTGQKFAHCILTTDTYIIDVLRPMFDIENSEGVVFSLNSKDYKLI